MKQKEKWANEECDKILGLLYPPEEYVEAWLAGYEFAKQKLIDGEPGIYHDVDQETIRSLGEDEIVEEKRNKVL